MNSHRLEKIKDLLRDEVGKIIKDEFEFEEWPIVTVTRTEISKTLEHATVFISILPQTKAKAVLKKIKSRIYFLQQILNKRLSMRPVPKIRFEIDRTEERADRIEKILNKL